MAYPDPRHVPGPPRAHPRHSFPRPMLPPGSDASYVLPQSDWTRPHPGSQHFAFSEHQVPPLRLQPPLLPLFLPPPPLPPPPPSLFAVSDLSAFQQHPLHYFPASRVPSIHSSSPSLLPPPLMSGPASSPWGQTVQSQSACPEPSVEVLRSIGITKERKQTMCTQSMKIPEARSLMCQYYALLSLLHSLHSQLASLPSSHSHSDWVEAMARVDSCKTELSGIHERFGGAVIEQLQGKLLRQCDRRKRLRKRARAVKEESKRCLEEREKAATAWLEARRAEELKKRMEKSVYREAGGVLGEVKLKQSEIKALVRLTTELSDLRKLRRNASRSRGDAPPITADEEFSATHSALLQLLHGQAQLYEEEEHALRVLMAEEVAERMAARGTQGETVSDPPQSTVDADPLVSFQQYYLQAQSSTDVLVTIRSEWDHFLSSQGSALPRKLPSPPPPSSELWAHYCANSH